MPGIPIPGICPMGLAEGLADGIGIFIPGIFIWGDACGLGEAEGMGMLCMCGVGDGVGEAAGICIPGMLGIPGVADGDAFGVGGVGFGFDPPADAGGSDFGVGDGIGIV